MRTRRAAAALLGLALAVLPATGGAAATTPGPAAADLPRLQADLAATTAQAQALAAALEQAAARDGGLRKAAAELAEGRQDARDRLEERVREVYIATGPRVLPVWSDRDPVVRALAERGGTAAVRVEQRLVDAVSVRSDRERELQARADAFRAGLQVQVDAVLAAQERARELLAQAQELAEQERARAAAQAERAAAERDRAALAAAAAALSEVSAAVTAAVVPAVTERGRRAAEAQRPVLALLVSAGGGYPRGWVASGQQVRGTASWYGPGFVGSPTASGAPYDPELPTCASKELPLGTVLRVSAGGRATSCLVTDRGPYVGDRVLDLSRAGSRALGYGGTAEVVAEVLRPT